MKLLLVQGLPRSAASLLSATGIDTVHVGEIGMSTADDSVILAQGRAENRVVVTIDADFHALLALSGATAPSVIRLRLEGLKAAGLVAVLEKVLDEWGEELELGALWLRWMSAGVACAVCHYSVYRTTNLAHFIDIGKSGHWSMLSSGA